MHGKWFRIRADLELVWKGETLRDEEDKVGGGGVVVVGEGEFDPKYFRGFCKGHGSKEYMYIQLPDELSTVCTKGFFFCFGFQAFV